jgi:hypothetical protein
VILNKDWSENIFLTFINSIKIEEKEEKTVELIISVYRGNEMFVFVGN